MEQRGRRAKGTARRILVDTTRQAHGRTRDASPRQLPTDHDHDGELDSIREYQSDQPSSMPFGRHPRCSTVARNDRTRRARLTGRSISVFYRKQPPFIRNALEGVRPAFGKPEARSGDQILDGARHEHVARPGQGSHSGRRMHGDPSRILGNELDLTRVQPGCRSPGAARPGRWRRRNGRPWLDHQRRQGNRRRSPVVVVLVLLVVAER